MSGELVQLVHLDSGDVCAYVGTWGPASAAWDEVGPEERARVGLHHAQQARGGEKMILFWVLWIINIFSFMVILESFLEKCWDSLK